MKLEQAFGSVLRKKRLEKNYTQEALAHSCKVDRTFIGLLERSKRQPTITTIFKLCKALDVKPSEIFIEIESMVDL
ncbi:DNA-binding transcriptional regulator, XRE-family HTH domain [Alkalibacterium gilvum]|uniref:DNA-binding transcriptional regulator, XRE-family HTH domain n=1 Tax=Alkalibacterium gilvum TaxID=1130080 RepID=A0A1H6VAQ7_9LACT|nr:helix-turn-helix transcriptional regulator [Alkalibacterium gilvum]SEJ00906.1 DNA-binding transcriptional regulator, XRE-family HTH domain [Alkalibacterium gilvum]